MSLNDSEIKDEKARISCQSCDKILEFPSDYSGKIRCPVCGHESYISYGDYVEYSLNESDKTGLFWKGLLIPIAPTLAAYLLLNVGILSGSSYPDFLGLSFFMFSFCLWPVIGFGLAYSSNTFVKPFRKGSLISAVLGLIIAILFWTLFFSWMSRGLAA